MGSYKPYGHCLIAELVYLVTELFSPPRCPSLLLVRKLRAVLYSTWKSVGKTQPLKLKIKCDSVRVTLCPWFCFPPLPSSSVPRLFYSVSGSFCLTLLHNLLLPIFLLVLSSPISVFLLVPVCHATPSQCYNAHLTLFFLGAPRTIYVQFYAFVRIFASSGAVHVGKMFCKNKNKWFHFF